MCDHIYMRTYQQKIIGKKLKALKLFFDEQLEHIDKQTTKRKSKIHTNHLFCALASKGINNSSYEEVTVQLRKKKLIADVTACAIHKKLNTGNYSIYLEQMIQKFTQLIDQTTGKKQNVFAVDGTKINLSSSMKDHGFELVGCQRYCQGLVTTIFNINHQMPYYSLLSSNHDERISLYNLLLKIEPVNHTGKDLLIFDRGYFSLKMVDTMSRFNKDFVFRLPCSLTIIKELIGMETDDHIFTSGQKQVRVIHYQKLNPKGKNISFFMGTSLFDKVIYPKSKIMDLYHSRWSIEEYYKKFKGQSKIGTNSATYSIKPEMIHCELLMRQFSITLTQYITSMLHVQDGYKINYHVSSDTIINDILPHLFIDKDPNHKTCHVAEMLNLLGIIADIIIKIRPDRSFPRKRIFPATKIYSDSKVNT